MSDRSQSIADMVEELRAAAPDMTLGNAIKLAIAAAQLEALDDVIVVLGDIADALNDMRPAHVSGRSVH